MNDHKSIGKAVAESIAVECVELAGHGDFFPTDKTRSTFKRAAFAIRSLLAEIEANSSCLKGICAGLKGLADQSYFDMFNQYKKDECLGWEAKVKNGKFGLAEHEAHKKAAELFGMHIAFNRALRILEQKKP